MAPRETNPTSYRILIFCLLFGTWLVLSGLFDAFHITLGLISCGLITWISSDLLFTDRSTSIARRGKQAVRLFYYLLWLLWQILLSNLHLFRLAFSSRQALQPQIVRYRTRLQSDFEKFLLANSITLTPGTVTIKIIGDTFYIHAISDTAAGGLDGQMESRIARIFDPGSRAEIEKEEA